MGFLMLVRWHLYIVSAYRCCEKYTLYFRFRNSMKRRWDLKKKRRRNLSEQPRELFGKIRHCQNGTKVCVGVLWRNVIQGWGLLNQFPQFRNFSVSPKYMLAIEYHVHIRQVSPQMSCGDTCQIRIWCKKSNRYFGRIENFADGEINEWSFSNPHPSYCSENYLVWWSKLHL